MTARDRLVLIIVSALAVLGVVWVFAISPERSKASKLGKEVATAAGALASAESQVANARGDQARYSAAYASIVSLGKAVPASEEVPSLIYQLAQASNQKHVEFNSITTTQSGSGSAAANTAATAATAGFTQMPFTFIFNGSFSDLYHLFQQLNSATVRTASGGLQVSGRLLTLQSVKLEPTTSTTGTSGSQKLTGTITATAYVLPAAQGLTAGATATSPTPAAGATTAAAGGSSTSTPAPVATIGAVR